MNDVHENLRNTCRVLICIDESENRPTIEDISNKTGLTIIQVTSACHSLRRKFKIKLNIDETTKEKTFEVRKDDLSIDPRKNKCTLSRSPVSKMSHSNNNTGRKLRTIACNLEDKIELLNYLLEYCKNEDDVMNLQFIIKDYESLRVVK